MGLLAAKSYEAKSVIDIEKALTYSLAPVSLPLEPADGMMRKTTIDNIFINGTGKHRKLPSIKSCMLTELQRQALVGVHYFTECDQNSSILRKSKMKCWKTAHEHLKTFSNLCTTYEVSDQLVKQLEAFVCALYVIKGINVDEARNLMFWNTLKKRKR